MKVEPEALGGPIGAAALRRLLALRGQRRELAEVRHALERAGEPRFAGGREALVALSAALGGLGATRVRLAATRADMLSERHLPALVEHEGRTWVLRELRGGRRLLDPGDGNPREVDQAALAEAFALWLDHPGEATEREGRSTAGRLLARALAARGRLLVEVALATLLTSLLAVAISFFALQVYDRVIPSFAYATLHALAGVVGVLIAFDFVLRLVRARLLDRVSREVDEEVSLAVFRCCLPGSLRSSPVRSHGSTRPSRSAPWRPLWWRPRS